METGIRSVDLLSSMMDAHRLQAIEIVSKISLNDTSCQENHDGVERSMNLINSLSREDLTVVFATMDMVVLCPQTENLCSAVL